MCALETYFLFSWVIELVSILTRHAHFIKIILEHGLRADVIVQSLLNFQNAQQIKRGFLS